MDQLKASIANDMSASRGRVRILLCTSSAGMGVNFSQINYVIHFAPPIQLTIYFSK